MAATIGDRVAVSVIESWQNPGGINERLVDRAILEIAAEYSVGGVGYDPRFGFSIGQRLQAAGLQVSEMAGVRFYAASQGLFEAVVNKRIAHAGDPLLAAQVNAAARQDVADGSWRISRKHSNVSIAGVVATAIAHLMASEPDRLPGLH
jgi:phage terminase large subunit-like protein